jgi:16S rRNA A1518/A1519 N6-dimethyltransferase RsmA/KsgA/DIM1 with predicted DNA glycosylase/AP lyase activity
VPAARRAAFLEFAGLVFRHPRKTLANNLRAAGYGAEALAGAREIGDTRERPGAWDVERLAALHARMPAPRGAVLE